MAHSLEEGRFEEDRDSSSLTAVEAALEAPVSSSAEDPVVEGGVADSAARNSAEDKVDLKGALEAGSLAYLAASHCKGAVDAGRAAFVGLGTAVVDIVAGPWTPLTVPRNLFVL